MKVISCRSGLLIVKMGYARDNVNLRDESCTHTAGLFGRKRRTRIQPRRIELPQGTEGAQAKEAAAAITLCGQDLFLVSGLNSRVADPRDSFDF